MVNNVDRNGNNNVFWNLLGNNKRTIEQLKKSFKGLAENIFDFGYSYMNEHNDVFSGSVAEETEKTLSYIHSLGVAMREGQPQTKFDRKI